MFSCEEWFLFCYCPKRFKRPSACKMGMFTLPSGAKYCRMPQTTKLAYDDADNYCKSFGFTGLAELESELDYVNIAGINVCKLS